MRRSALLIVGLICSLNFATVSNLEAVPVTGGTGPGGLGTTDGTSNLKLWLKPETLSAGAVSTWTDSSGSGYSVSGTGTQRPTLTTGVLNVGTQNVVRFLSASQQQLTRTGFDNSPNKTIFTVSASADVTRWNPIFLHQQNPGMSYGWNSGSFNRIYLIENDISLQALSTSTFSNNTFNIAAGTWAGAGANLANSQQIFINGNAQTTSADPMALGSGLVVEVGSRQASSQYLQGDIAEVITFNTNLGVARRSIVENYLSAKYNLGLTTGNHYVGDDSGNGDYDRDVIGVGNLSGDSQANSGAAGFGIQATIGTNANELNNNEFIMAGHREAANSLLSTTIQGFDAELWKRVWYVDATGTSADTTLGFNFDNAGLTGLLNLSKDYRLVYTNQVGLTNWQILPQIMSLQTGNVLSFNVLAGGLANGYYTLAAIFQPVPEPSSVILVVVGMGLVHGRRRMKSPSNCSQNA